LRAAINDLQAVAEGKKELRESDVVTAKRLREADIFKVMQKIFKTKIPVYSIVMLLDESPEDFIMWIDENLPLEYRGEELREAYEYVSRADVFLGRVKKRQYYRLWRYAMYLMSCGVQQVKKEKKKGFTRYRRPVIWQMLFQTKSKREKLKSVLSKIGKYSHMSRRKAIEMLPVVKLLLNQNLEIAANVAAFYSFDESELEFLVGTEKAKEIVDYVEKKGLHRVEDEELFEKYEKEKYEKSIERAGEPIEEREASEKEKDYAGKETEEVEETEETEEKSEEKKTEKSRGRKKGKESKTKKTRKTEKDGKKSNMTLDSFFG